MARDVKEMLSVADGGAVGPPDVEAIQRRARRLTLRRAGAVAGVGLLLVVAAIGAFALFEPPRIPLVGEGPQSPSIEPAEPAEADVPETGPPIWVTELDVTSFGEVGSGSQLASDGQRLFVASGHAEDAAVVALDLATGAVGWRTDLEGSAFVQVTTDELVIANSQHHQVVALDVETGDRVWELELPAGYGAVSAAVSGGTLYLVAGAGGEGDTSPPRIDALNLDDGELRWSTTLTDGTDPQWSPPEIVDGFLLVAATLAHPQVEPGNQVHALALTDGTQAWSVDLGGSQGFNTRATAVTDELLHVGVPGLGVASLDVATGAISHTIENANLVGAGARGPLYVSETGERTVRGVDPETGEPLDQQPTWKLPLGFFEIHADGQALLLLSARRPFGIDTDSGALAWRHTHETPAYEMLVVDDLLIAANEDGQIVATQLPVQ